MKLLIDPQELNTLVESHPDIDFCIVDLSSEHSYLAGHINGAVPLNPGWIVNGQAPRPGDLPGTAQLNQLFSALGLTDNTHFIVCDDEGGGWAGRFIWLLDAIGHPHYSLLDGGMLAWKAEGLPLSQSAHQRSPTKASISLNTQASVNLEEITRSLNELTIWDARSAAEYNGAQRTAIKCGHIPGAINCEWTSLMDAQRHYRIRSDALEYLNDCGIKSDANIVTHCHSHHRSGYTYFVGKFLGLNIRAYPGSWAEWGNHPDTTVEI